MAAQAPAKNDTTALETWTPNAVQQLMDTYPSRSYNRLFPIDVISQVNPMLAPKVEIVRLNPDPNAGEIYHSDDMKAGHYAPTKVALRRLSDLAGLSVIASRRMDDGADPWYVLWQVELELTVPGRRPRRAIGSKEIRLSGDSVKGWSPARLGKAREHMVRMAESKATNAAIRDLLTLRSSYTQAELSLPFAVFSWQPNMAHPQVAERFLDNLLPATTAAFGPDPKALPAGDQDVEIAPRRPDDDEDPHTTEGEYREVRTNGHATVHVATGEIVKETPAAAAEPDWFGEPVGTTPSLIDRLRAYAEEAPENGDHDELMDALREGFAGIPKDPNPNLVIVAAFAVAALPQITARHAAAIVRLGNEIGWDRLREQWSEAAAEAARSNA